jgi:hypothetical protein
MYAYMQTILKPVRTHIQIEIQRGRERASNPIIIFMKPKFENYDVIYHVKN